MKKSWVERHALWKIPLGLLTLLLLMLIFGIVVFTVVTTSFRHSDVYQKAMRTATSDPQVREQLGEPIKAAWAVSGELNLSGSTGHANLSIPISGPRGSGVIRAVADKSGIWKFSCLEVEMKGRAGKIELLSVQPPVQREF
jgi:hypothetical protein